jgi:hypothetical protein
VWARDEVNLHRAERDFLLKVMRGLWKYDLDEVILRANCDSFGNARIEVEVEAGFFAPQLSPLESWYINLWHGEPAWDECEILHRRVLAYVVQTPLLLVWIPLYTLLRLVWAVMLVVFLTERGVSWSAVWRPFSYTFGQIFPVEEGERRSWLCHDKDGNERWGKPVLEVFMPIALSVISVGALMLAWALSKVTGEEFSWLMLWRAYAGILFGAVVGNAIRHHLDKNAAERRRLREERRKKEILDYVYNDLLCTTAPPLGPRTTRPGFVAKATLAYHRAKAAVCRPVAAG